MDEKDRQLLNLIQNSFPLVSRPYRELGERLGESEPAVIERLDRLRRQHIVRQISAIFDTKSLGYKSSLVAMKLSPERIAEAARIINEHPGVSHNYLRNHEFNLWFTIATEPDSKLGLDGTLELLQRLTGAESVRQLPTLTLF